MDGKLYCMYGYVWHLETQPLSGFHMLTWITLSHHYCCTRTDLLGCKVGLNSHPIEKCGIFLILWATVRPVKLHLIVFCVHNCIWLENVLFFFTFLNFVLSYFYVQQISRNISKSVTLTCNTRGHWIVHVYTQGLGSC